MKPAPRNQRISSGKRRKQQHLLEVTVRADKARVMRNRRIAAMVFQGVLAVSLVVGLWLGGKELLRRFVWENPDYFLTEIRISTDGALQRDQILQAGNVRTGVNIFTVSTESIRAGIDKLPQVERAEIQKVLPNRVDINITERRPIAWVTESADENPTASDRAWLVDARGVMMKTKRMMEEYYSLPHISGVAVANCVPGQKINTVEFQAAIQLVRLDSDNLRWQARNIDLTKGYCLVVTDQNHARITFGLDDIEQQMDRLFRYLDRAEADKKEIQTINLLVRKNTPVTFHHPAADDVPSPTPPPPPKPSSPASGASEKPKEKEKEKDKEKEPAIPRAIPVNKLPAPTPAAVKAKPEAKSNWATKPKATPTVVRKPFRP